MVNYFVEQTPPKLIIDTLEKSGIGLALKALVGVFGIPAPTDWSLFTLERLNSRNFVDDCLTESLFGSKNLYYGICLALNGICS